MRELQLEVVVETGTAAGSNTGFLLSAPERNGKGRLISIDLPPIKGELTMDETILEKDVGYLIPYDFRSRWECRKGDAKIILPQVLAEFQVDVFVHDSLHTRTHMLFEYAVARALLPENALILSDDILWNNAFDSFVSINRLTAYAGFGNTNFGAMINRFDKYEREIGLGVVTKERA